MQPRAEPLAPRLVHQGTFAVPATAQLFRLGDRVLAAGGGVLVDIDVAQPPDAWRTHPIADGLFARDPDDAPPLLVAVGGPILRLQPDLSLRPVAAEAFAGEASAFALADGCVLVLPAERDAFGMYLFDEAGRCRWRLRADDPVLAAFSDVIVSVASGTPDVTLCRDTSTGDERWRRRGESGAAATLVAIVDDAAWLSDGPALVAVGLEDGKERARINTGVLAWRPRVDPDGRAHLLFGALRHWFIDLRAGQVISRAEIAGDPPRDPYPMESLVGSGVLAHDGAGNIYRFDARHGYAFCPAPLWRAPALPVSAVVHRHGIVVITEPAHRTRATPHRTVHWLAPAP
jgi:hypothetical protein